MARIYDEVCAFEIERTKILKDDITSLFAASTETFLDVPEEDRESLQYFSLICMLALDVYVKKQIIEKLIDAVPETTEQKRKK